MKLHVKTKNHRRHPPFSQNTEIKINLHGFEMIFCLLGKT
jgi:hypothetical protein